MPKRIYSILFLFIVVLFLTCCKSTHVDENYEYIITTDTGLLNGFKNVRKHGYKHVIVKNGTYDIISEYKTVFGKKYFEEYVTGYNDFKNGYFDTGIFIENAEVRFEVGTKVFCNYTGSNLNVKKYFSAFSTGNNVTIDGLYLESSELRYGIHADFNTGCDESYMIIKNCNLKFDDSNGRCQVLGCGLGEHVSWIFENNYFNSSSCEPVLTIHNNISSKAQSSVVLMNNYIDGEGYFLFNNYSSSKLITYITLCGNSWINQPMIGYETIDSEENIRLIEYNNEKRESENVK